MFNGVGLHVIMQAGDRAIGIIGLPKGGLQLHASSEAGFGGSTAIELFFTCALVGGSGAMASPVTTKMAKIANTMLKSFILN